MKTKSAVVDLYALLPTALAVVTTSILFTACHSSRINDAASQNGAGQGAPPSSSGAAIAPSNLTYIFNPVNYAVGSTIANNIPTIIGIPTSFSINPALPLGLSIDATTGVISGTPLSSSALKTYAVTASNAAGSTATTLSITVILPAASLAFTPASKSFGTFIAGSGQASTQTFTVTNSGNAPASNVFVAFQTGSNLSLANNTCGTFGSSIPLAEGGTCSVDVIFTTPASGGSLSDGLIMTYDDGATTGLTLSAALDATINAAGSLAFNPTSKNFGTFTAGSGQTSTQTFTITNSGGTSASNAYVAFQTGTDFTLLNNSCGTSGSKITIPSNSTCTVDVKFTPPASTGSLSDNLIVTYDNGATTGVTASVGLTATTATPGALAFSPSSKSFGTFVSGSGQTSTQTFTITNSGGSSATNTYVALQTGTNLALLNNNCGTSGSKITVPPNSTCTVDVKFTTPSSAGSLSDNLIVTYDTGATMGATTSAGLSATIGVSMEVPIELTDCGLSSSTSAILFDRTRTTLDTNAYDGSPVYYFEIVASDTDSTSRTVDLVDSSGAAVATITVPMSAPAATLLPRVAFIPTSGADNYRLRLAGTTLENQLSVHAARIYVKQTAATKTKIYIPLSAALTSSISNLDSNSSGVDSAYTTAFTSNAVGAFSYWQKNTNNLGTLDTTTSTPWTLEMVMAGAVASDIVTAALINNTTGQQVGAATVSTTNTIPTLLSASFANNAAGFSHDTDEFYLAHKNSSNHGVNLYRAGLWVSLNPVTTGEVYYRTGWQSTTAGSDVGRRIVLDTSQFSNPSVFYETTSVGTPNATPVYATSRIADGGNCGSCNAGTNVTNVLNIETTSVKSRQRQPVTLTSGNYFVNRTGTPPGTSITVSSGNVVVGFH